MEAIVRHLKGFGSLFYLVNPYETMFEKEEDIPRPDWVSSVSCNKMHLKCS